MLEAPGLKGGVARLAGRERLGGDLAAPFVDHPRDMEVAVGVHTDSDRTGGVCEAGHGHLLHRQ
jgi:hypothetical protein